MKIDYQFIVPEKGAERRKYAHIDLGKFHQVTRPVIGGRVIKQVVFEHWSEELQKHEPLLVHWTEAFYYWLLTQDRVSGVIWESQFGDTTTVAQGGFSWGEWRVHFARPRIGDDMGVRPGDRWNVENNRTPVLTATMAPAYLQHDELTAHNEKAAR